MPSQHCRKITPRQSRSALCRMSAVAVGMFSVFFSKQSQVSDFFERSCYQCRKAPVPISAIGALAWSKIFN